MGRLDQVDWDAVYARQWNDTSDDMDRQRRKQAEFLIHGSVPWGLISGIGVYSEPGRIRVEEALALAGLAGSIPVSVRTEWYY